MKKSGIKVMLVLSVIMGIQVFGPVEASAQRCRVKTDSSGLVQVEVRTGRKLKHLSPKRLEKQKQKRAARCFEKYLQSLFVVE